MRKTFTLAFTTVAQKARVMDKLGLVHPGRHADLRVARGHPLPATEHPMTADEFNALLAQLGWSTSFLAYRKLGMASDTAVRRWRSGQNRIPPALADSGWSPRRSKACRHRRNGSDGEACDAPECGLRSGRRWRAGICLGRADPRTEQSGHEHADSEPYSQTEHDPGQDIAGTSDTAKANGAAQRRG
jgi:hypothetical protein